MKKGFWLAVVIAAGCGTPPVGVDGPASESTSAAVGSEIRDDLLTARRGGRKPGQQSTQDPLDATICGSSETGVVACRISDPMPIARFTAQQ